MEMNRLPPRWKIAAALSLVIGLIGCDPQVVTPQATMIHTNQASGVSTPVQRETITPTVHATDKKTCQLTFKVLDGLSIQAFWWNSNSKEIIFLTEMGKKGLYDVSTHTYTYGDIGLPTEKNITEDIIRLIPGSFDGSGVHLAPSGDKAIYTKAIANGEEVPTPQDIGETGSSKLSTEVYWLDPDMGIPIHINQFEGQVNVIWSDSEEKVLLFPMTPSGPFGSITLWVFDITDMTLKKLLDPTDRDIYPITFTPDGEGVIYQIGDEVRLIDIHNLTQKTLTIPPFKYFWWISSEQFIALSPVDERITQQKILLYNISKDSSSILSDTTINPIPFNFYAIKISPDKSTIAFIDDSNNYLTIMSLCQG